MTNLATTNADPMQAFKARIAERLRADIGELIPDAVVTQMIEQAVQQEFFKSYEVSEGYSRRTMQPWFVRDVAAKAEPMLREKVDAFLTTHEHCDPEGTR